MVRAVATDTEHLVTDWAEAGFDEFEGQLAHADGFAPRIAVHYRTQLKKIAESWRQVGMADEEGLRWHIAGFPAAVAADCRRRGLTLDEVRPPAGYGPGGLGRITGFSAADPGRV